jgi:hypothetical protein
MSHQNSLPHQDDVDDVAAIHTALPPNVLVPQFGFFTETDLELRSRYEAELWLSQSL